MKKQSSKINLYYICSILLLLLLSSGCATAPSITELADVYYNLGNAYSELGRQEDAGSAYRRAYTLEPGFIQAGYSLGRMDIEEGKYSEGIAIFRKLEAKDPENILVKEALAWGYYRKGDTEEALQWYKNILSDDAYNERVLHNISFLLMSAGNYADAYPYLEQLEKIGSPDFFTYRELGVAESKMGISSGVVWFEKARKEKPDDKDILMLLASAYAADKNYTEALATYDQLLSKHRDPEILFDKAFILLTAVEDYDKGLSVLKEALAGGFGDQKKIKKLKDYPDLLYKERIVKVLKEAGKTGLPH